MAPKTLASLAHALSVAHDLDAALVALGESLADVDRAAQVALLRLDGKRKMLADGLHVRGLNIESVPLETTFDHLPATARPAIETGGSFVDLGDKSTEYLRLLGFTPFPDGGLLSLRGLRHDGLLVAVLALQESRRIFGSRTAERFAPSVSLFELALWRHLEREAKDEAVQTLETVMQRVHSEYDRRLSSMEGELSQARDEVRKSGTVDASQLVHLEREAMNAREEARKAGRRADKVEQQVTAAVGQLEQVHLELHRRTESLRAKTRTIYLIDRMLGLDAEAEDPRTLAEGLLNLAGDDMQAQRSSLMLVEPGTDMLYLAALRGVAPSVEVGQRVPLGTGVAGKVARTRETLLVQDVNDAKAHALLQDEFFTTGSFISTPLVYRGDLVGVMNLTNRARFGVFVEDDVERVRILALVMSLIAVHSRLPERLLETLSAR
jgi:putative methionine-R-sulfoxide reductase with GAF domain